MGFQVWGFIWGGQSSRALVLQCFLLQVLNCVSGVLDLRRSEFLVPYIHSHNSSSLDS